ncbi:MAG: RHS repeat-associated core domain-containing protein [Thermoguttaceae bacterium]
MTGVTQSGGDYVAPKQVDFSYCACGCCLTGVDSYDSLDTSAPVAQTAYSYGYARRMTGARTTDGGNNPLSSYGWTYDADGRVTTATSSQDPTLTYSYDQDSQLTGVNSVQSSYDDNGNLGAAGDIVGPGNRLLYDGTYYYSYDADGNRTAKFKNSTSGDGQLDSTASDITTYTWDNRDRLTSVSYQAAFGGPYSYVMDYTYDASDRLVTADQTVGGGSAPLAEAYFYDGQNMVLVLNPSGSVTERELYGPGGQVLASESPLPSGEGQGEGSVVSWMLTDNEGSVRDVVQYSVGGGTTPVDHLTYDAFGNITYQTPGAVTPRFTYAGRQLDPVTGLYYDGARWYDSGVGGFICQDPSGFAAGDANLYRYCGNDPVSETDPSGLSSSGQGPCSPSCPCGCQSGQVICLSTGYDGEDCDGDGPSEGAPEGGTHAVATGDAAGGPGFLSSLGSSLYSSLPGMALNVAESASPMTAQVIGSLNAARVESGRVAQAYQSLRRTGGSVAGSAMIAWYFGVEDVIGGTDLSNAFTGADALTGQPLNSSQRVLGVGTGLMKWIGTSLAVAGGLDGLDMLPEGPLGVAPAPAVAPCETEVPLDIPPGDISPARTPGVSDRLPRDVNVNPEPPSALPTDRPVGPSACQNAQAQADIQAAKNAGAEDIRVNQQQVNADGERVGVNRPDTQMTQDGYRVYDEYQNPNDVPGGEAHMERTFANDPNGISRVNYSK